MGINPTSIPFPVIDSSALLVRAATHEKYVKDTDTNSAAIKPRKLTKEVKKEEWLAVFYNYMRIMPRRNGVPLYYVIRDNDLPDPTPKPDILDMDINYTLLVGDAFNINKDNVQTFYVDAEVIIKVQETKHKGRINWKALKQHHKGMGIYAINIIKAEN